MNEARAYSPASISLVFRIHPHTNPVEMGSTGIGFTIDHGVRAEVTRNKANKLFFNNRETRLPTVSWVKRALTKNPVEIRLTTDLPLGCGFGLSGASALATSFALNKLFDVSKHGQELVELTHKAEVKHKTGLGDVATQTRGGFLIRTRPGIPGRARRLPFAGKKIYATIIGPLDTPSVLTDSRRLKKINREADQALDEALRDKLIALEEILDISFTFATKSGLMMNHEVASLITTIRNNGGHATMAMLGNVVISTQRPKVNNKYQIKELRIVEDALFC